ncbi:MAG: DUF1549 domain-containing protein, partial [Sphingobacteriaceae bacterium]|nr:DUF1549 domain-containing protein [Cytophagaceae bacterium]
MRKILPFLGVCATLLLYQGCGGPTVPDEVATALGQLPEKLDFNIHVKPILSDKCFACHGPDKTKQKAGLRFDLPESAFAYQSKESGRHALVPGSRGKSEVVARILSANPKERMPTPESHLTLSAEEKATLLRWIEDGAEYKPHWSLVAPVKPEIPEVKKEGWVKNDIDRFVLKKLEEKGLAPSAEADKETLLRRVSLDLTGLPPTLAEREAFLTDNSPNAYEKVVNRLLRSPHFGERMATSWLDLARYADTRGYQIDFSQAVYPYRDWVIRSFNRNLAFDKFVTWQLAGDLVPKPSLETRLATCFLRLHPQNEEDGIIDEECRTEYVIDRVNTFGKAFLAFSVECARCHDHKYDAIAQKEFYQFFAYFNSNNEAGLIPHLGEASPALTLFSRASADSLRRIRAFIHRLQVAEIPAESRAGFKTWSAGLAQSKTPITALHIGEAGHFSLDDSTFRNQTSARIKTRFVSRDGKPRVFIPGTTGKALRLDGGMGLEFDTTFNVDRHQPFSFSLWLNVLDKSSKGGPLVGKSNGKLNGNRGYFIELNEDKTLTITLAHIYPDNAIELKTKEKLPLHSWQNLTLTYDGSSKAAGVGCFLNGRKLTAEVLNDNLHKSMLYVYGTKNYPLGAANFRIGYEKDRSISGVAVDDFRFYRRTLTTPDLLQLAGQDAAVQTLVRTPASQRTALQTQQLFDWYLSAFDKTYPAQLAKIAVERSRENTLLTNQREVMAYREATKPRKTFVLSRGVYDAPKEEVFPGVPVSMNADKKARPKNRLALAEWLLAEENPLFARVMVNRFWYQAMGRGIVKTTDDFGNQGTLPTHPELLDFLAVNFRESGWNVKALMQQLVLSATYRQSSVPTKISLEKDPDNLLFSRAPSYRHAAEIVRDNALTAAGLLNPKIGGPSVKPYQPAGLWEALARGSDRDEVYVQDHGDKLYRR